MLTVRARVTKLLYGFVRVTLTWDQVSLLLNLLSNLMVNVRLD